MRRPGVLLTIAIIMTVPGGQISGGQAVRVPGTGVALVPPEGFAVAQRFPGFEQVGLQASIMISELPGSAADMKAGLTTQALGGQGLALLNSLTVRIDGADALLLELAQQAGGIDVLKWMLVAGDQNSTILVVATFPRAAASDLGDRLRASVLTTTRVAERSPDVFEGLRFRVIPSARLKLARRMSNMLALTESGALPVAEDEPLLIVGSAVAEFSISDLRTFSEWRAAQTATLKNIRNLKGRSIQVGGLDAYELTGDAADAKTGARIKLYQVVVPDEGSYFIIQGLAPSKRSTAMMEEFRQVTATFRLEPPKASRHHPESARN